MFENTIKDITTGFNVKTVRGSFNCLLYKTLKEVGGWEGHMFEPMLTDKGKPHFRKEKGLGGLGNICLLLFSYKFNKMFGPDKIGYLSDFYLDSPYIYECARGGQHPTNPMIESEQWKEILKNKNETNTII